jgi:hypothetical protein
MLIIVSVAISLLVARVSFHWFYEDIHDCLTSWGRARDHRAYGLLWTDRQRWSDAALANAKFTVYLALVVGSGLLTFFGVRGLLGIS